MEFPESALYLIFLAIHLPFASFFLAISSLNRPNYCSLPVLGQEHSVCEVSKQFYPKKLIEFLTATDKKSKFCTTFTPLSPLYTVFNSFYNVLDALGTTTPIFKLLVVTKVGKNIVQALMTNHLSLELENKVHACFVLGCYEIDLSVRMTVSLHHHCVCV